jgi:hypothetical protein
LGICLQARPFENQYGENGKAQAPASLTADAIGIARPSSAWFGALLFLLALGPVLTVLIFYPGYVTADASYVYADAKAWHFGDWQSPIMAVLWRLIDPVAPGSLSMFLLIVALYWSGFGLLALNIRLRSPALGLLTPFLALAPPAFFFVGMIWRDVLFGAMWLLAGVLAFVSVEQGRRTRLVLQLFALVLIAMGVLLRPNSLIAAPLLAIYVVSPRRIEMRSLLLGFIPAAIAFYLLIPVVYYGLLGAERQNPLHQIFVFDLGGITHFTGENQFPVTWTADETTLLTSQCYDPVRWDSYWHVEPCPFVMRRLERRDDVIFGTPRLIAAWRQAVIKHPFAYLAHRGSFSWQFLARSNLVLPVWDWLDPASSYGHRPYFRPIVVVHDVLQPTLLFWPGLWLLIAAAIAAVSWRRRMIPAGAFAFAVTACACLYVLSFSVLGVASDFRYAYWCVLAALAGAVAACAPATAREAAAVRNGPLGLHPLRGSLVSTSPLKT